jgi:hypothetical protein
MLAWRCGCSPGRNQHGGRDRWLAVTSLSAPVSMGGSLWSGKGHDGAPASNQAAVYCEFGGLLFPTRRRVTARRADGAAGIGPTLVSIDFGEIIVR